MLSKTCHQLLNDAVKHYLKHLSPEEQLLEASSERLSAYPKRDPGFRSAMTAFVESEANLEDPVEENHSNSLEPVRPLVPDRHKPNS